MKNMKHIKSFCIINEKISVDIEKLKSDVSIFRKKLEDEYEWYDNKNCFKGSCHYVASDLVKYLTNLGYDAHRQRGYYKNASDDFYPDTSEWDLEDVMRLNRRIERNYDSANGVPFPHWWVIVNNYIIDVTEDQFHPNEEDEYRIGIYKKPNSYYKNG